MPFALLRLIIAKVESSSVRQGESPRAGLSHGSQSECGCGDEEGYFFHSSCLQLQENSIAKIESVKSESTEQQSFAAH
jgi:hypothetical protein